MPQDNHTSSDPKIVKMKKVILSILITGASMTSMAHCFQGSLWNFFRPIEQQNQKSIIVPFKINEKTIIMKDFYVYEDVFQCPICGDFSTIVILNSEGGIGECKTCGSEWATDNVGNPIDY